MSMVFCPECTERVSAAAAVCPHCGFPLAEGVAKSPVMANRAMALLTSKGIAQSQRDLAADELANPSLLEALAHVCDVEVARVLAQNPSTPISVLDKLAQVDDEELLFYVARNDHAEAETLAGIFSKITPQETASNCAQVPAVSEADDTEHRAVKVALALNRNTPENVLNVLYEDDRDCASAAVFGNGNLPKRSFYDNVDGTIDWIGPCGMLNPLIPRSDFMLRFDRSTL